MFCFNLNSDNMRHTTLILFALLLLFQNGSCVKKKNRNVMIIKEEATENNNSVETTTDASNLQSVQTSYFGFGGPVDFVPHSFQQSSPVYGFGAKTIKEMELFNSMPNKVKEMEYAKIQSLNRAIGSEKISESTNSKFVSDLKIGNYVEETTSENYGSQPIYDKNVPPPPNLNFGSKISQVANYAHSQPNANYGTIFSNTNYGPQSPNVNYASNASMTNFIPQESNSNYAPQTSNENIGSQQPDANYASEVSNEHYGSQLSNENYASEISNANYVSHHTNENSGSQTPNLNYVSEPFEKNQDNEQNDDNYVESSKRHYVHDEYNNNYNVEQYKRPQILDSTNKERNFDDISKINYEQETTNDNYVADPSKRSNMEYSLNNYATQSSNIYDLAVPDNTDPNLMRFTSSVAKPLKPISPMSQEVQHEFEKYLIETYNLGPISSRNNFNRGLEETYFPPKPNKGYDQHYYDLKSKHNRVNEKPPLSYHYSERVQSFGNPVNSLSDPYNSQFKPSKFVGIQNNYDEIALTTSKPPETLSSSSFTEFYKNKYKNKEKDEYINEFEVNHDSFYGSKPLRAVKGESYWRNNMYGGYGNIYDYASAFHTLQNDERKKLGYNKEFDSYDYRPWSKNPYPNYSKGFYKPNLYENLYMLPDYTETANTDYNFAISKPYKTRFKNEEELLPLRNRDVVKPHHTYSKHGKLSGRYSHGLKSYANSYDSYNVAPDKWNKLRHGDSYRGRTKHIAYPIAKPFLVGVPHPVLVPIPQPYPVQVPVPRPVAVPIFKELRVPIEQQVPYPVYKNVPYPVEKLVPVLIEKEVPAFKPYPVRVPHERPSQHHTPPGYADAPLYTDVPPRYADGPYRYADMPYRYSDVPPRYADVPSHYADLPPRYAGLPLRYADTTPYDVSLYDTSTRRRRTRRPPKEYYGNYRRNQLSESQREGQA